MIEVLQEAATISKSPLYKVFLLTKAEEFYAQNDDLSASICLIESLNRILDKHWWKEFLQPTNDALTEFSEFSADCSKHKQK